MHDYSNQVQDGKGINRLCIGHVGLCRKLLHATAAINVTLPNNSFLTLPPRYFSSIWNQYQSKKTMILLFIGDTKTLDYKMRMIKLNPKILNF